MEENRAHPYVYLSDFRANKPELDFYLVRCLEADDKWKKLLYKFRTHYTSARMYSISPHELQLMSTHATPGVYFLNWLESRLCPFKLFLDLTFDKEFIDIYSILTVPEKLSIYIQPAEDYGIVEVESGGELVLECYALGYPLPSYEWYCDNKCIDSSSGPLMRIKHFSAESEGDYSCKVSHFVNGRYHFLMSNSVICQVAEILPVIEKQPPPEMTSLPMRDVQISVEVNCPSAYSVQWLKSNSVIEGATCPTLTLKNVSRSSDGLYHCVISNKAGEVFSSACRLEVEYEAHETRAVSIKVALLIANSHYDNFEQLSTPVNDVVLLSSTLKELGFYVLTLMNLTLVEMNSAFQWFTRCLQKDAYALLYYVGHGFEIFNNKFLMPVDCPQTGDYRMAHCICDQNVIKLLMEARPQLTVIILDMCLRSPDRIENPSLLEEKAPNVTYARDSSCGLIYACATSSHMNSYELVDQYHGTYMQNLMKFIKLDQPVIRILEQAHDAFSKHKLAKKQRPCVKFDDSKRRLTDPIIGFYDAEMLLKVTEIDKSVELDFLKLGEKVDIIVQPHRGEILNAIDLIFPYWFDQWKVTADLSPEVLTFIWGENEVRQMVLTILNIQKVKSECYITVSLNKAMGNTLKLVDNFCLDLGTPLIGQAKLWYSQPQSIT